MIDPIFKNEECVIEILRVIRKNKDIGIENLTTKQKIHNFNGKDIEMDIYSKVKHDITKHIDLEIQNDKDKAPIKRLIYYLGMLLSYISDKGQDWKEIPLGECICIMKKDYFQKGLPIYNIKLMIEETHEVIKGYGITVVNGEYDGEDEIGELIHDMKCSDYQQIRNKVLRKHMKYYKGTKEGEKEMTELLEKLIEEEKEEGYNQGKEDGKEEGNKQGKKEDVHNLMETMSLSLEQALKALKITYEDYLTF